MFGNTDSNWLKDLEVDLVVELGETKKTVEEILQWRKGSTIKLENSTANILKIYVNNRFFGLGDVLRNEDGEMNLRINEINK